MKKMFPLLAILTVLSTALLSATDDALSILKNMEERLMGSLAPKDMTADLVMNLQANGVNKIRQLRTWSKSVPGKDDWRVMKFLSPADIRDLGFLVLAANDMYLYLPEFRRIRRIASSSKKDAFVGSDFSYDDIGTSGFSAHFEAKLVAQDARSWTLELTRKPGADKPYAKIVLTISKETQLPQVMKMFDNSGNLWKEAIETFQQIGNYWVFASITMSDKKKDSSTLLEFRNVKTDQKLADDIFSERFLKKPLE